MEAMPRKLPLHVVRERTRHGTVNLYFRQGKGPRTRLPSDLRSPEFRDAYKRLLAGEKPTAPSERSGPVIGLRWLVARYMESGGWAGLSRSTRGARGYIFANAVERAGNPDFRDIDTAAIARSLDARRATPAQAGAFLKAMRGLFQWAKLNGHVASDPTIGVKPPRYESDGFEPWTLEDWAKFCNRWPLGTMPRRAAEIFLFSGLRKSDAVRAGKQHLKGNVLTMRTEKTGTAVSVELPPHLVADLGRAKDLTFITGATGHPFKKTSFGNWFRDRCNEAGVSKSAHGIRKLSATLAANGGATSHELMAQFGWASTKQAEVYTKGADRAALGVKSSRRIVAQIEDANPAPPSHVRGELLKA